MIISNNTGVQSKPAVITVQAIPSYTYDLQGQNLIDHDESDSVDIQDFDNTYTIVVKNLTALVQPVRLFGALQGIPDFLPNLSVTVLESSYPEVMNESDLSPFIVGAMTVNASHIQFQRQYQIVRRDPTGVNFVRPFHPGKYLSVFQYQSGFVDIYPIAITIDSYTSIQFNLGAFETISFTLYVIKRIREENQLHDLPVIEISHNIPEIFKEDLYISI